MLMLLITLFSAFFLLLVFDIFNLLRIESSSRHLILEKQRAKEKISAFVDLPEDQFSKDLEEFAFDAMNGKKNYLKAIDEYLLSTLENPGIRNRERLISVARRLGFIDECVEQISDENRRVSAHGSRRAGLYNVKEAIDGMKSVLDKLYTENQFEILMSLARIGQAEPMQLAFDKIKQYIIINERGIIEILSVFPKGTEKEKLFRNMIHCDTAYITALFLKALDREMARLLVQDIVSVLSSGEKEVRAAAVKALGSLGEEAPAEALVGALKDDSWEIRALAAKALSFAKDRESGGALLGALHDAQWWVRQNAANSLAGREDYREIFLEAAKSDDKYAIDSIIHALEKKGDTDTLKIFKETVASK